jgi:hypothetical protein
LCFGTFRQTAQQIVGPAPERNEGGCPGWIAIWTRSRSRFVVSDLLAFLLLVAVVDLFQKQKFLRCGVVSSLKPVEIHST